MLKEIHEQPEALRAGDHRPGRRATTTSGSTSSTGSPRRCRASTAIELIACGTAYYAALVGAAAIQDWIGIPARATVGSEFRYSPPPLDERTLVIAVTQSGETADTIAPTRLARERGCPVIAVTNTVGSAITREADAVLFLQAGPEIAVAASKTFVDPGHDARHPRGGHRQGRGARSARAGAGARRRPCARCPTRRPGRSRAPRAPRSGAPLRQLARLHVRRARLHVPGRARGRPQAQGSELRPRRGLRRRRDEARPDLAARRRVPARRGRDALVGLRQAHQQRHGGSRARRPGHRRRDRGRRRRSSASPTTSAGCPDTHEALSPVLAIIPLQLFAYHVAIARGTDVDQPRNLAKSVTVE